MMIQHLLNTDLKDKKVLDMGSGTGVLAIVAEREALIRLMLLTLTTGVTLML